MRDLDSFLVYDSGIADTYRIIKNEKTCLVLAKASQNRRTLFYSIFIEY